MVRPRRRLVAAALDPQLDLTEADGRSVGEWLGAGEPVPSRNVPWLEPASAMTVPSSASITQWWRETLWSSSCRPLSDARPTVSRPTSATRVPSRRRMSSGGTMPGQPGARRRRSRAGRARPAAGSRGTARQPGGGGGGSGSTAGSQPVTVSGGWATAGFRGSTSTSGQWPGRSRIRASSRPACRRRARPARRPGRGGADGIDRPLEHRRGGRRVEAVAGRGSAGGPRVESAIVEPSGDQATKYTDQPDRMGALASVQLAPRTANGRGAVYSRRPSGWFVDRFTAWNSTARPSGDQVGRSRASEGSAGAHHSAGGAACRGRESTAASRCPRWGLG